MIDSPASRARSSSEGNARNGLRAAHLTGWALLAMVCSGCWVEDLATPSVPHPAADAAPRPVEVHQPESLSSLPTKLRDPRGRTVGVSCMTCHSLRTVHPIPASAEELEGIHEGLVFDHGEQSCRACHDPNQADMLHLADGSQVGMEEAMRLCAQCHGTQARDWEGGSHGGMRGYWDRRRGTTTRNHCIDCHDPHQPRFPTYRPAPPTRDRFLGAGGHDGQ